MAQLVYSAPSDAEAFWRQDSGFIFNLVRKHLGQEVSAADAEDAAAEIIESLLKSRNDQGQNALEQYSAGYVSKRTSKPVTWRGFLSGKVMLYIRGKRESIARRNGRELLLCDTEAGDGGERWVELFGGKSWDDYPALADADFETRVRNYLAALPAAWGGPGSLFEVFNEILERLKAGEKATMVAGLTRKQTAQALVRIRELVLEALAAPVRGPIVIAGVELSPAEVRDALDRLKAASGNHVHRALAGHKLTLEGGTGRKAWYHKFARAELGLYPGCAVAAREGKVGGAGAGHVKAAVIHGLERLLTGVPEAPVHVPPEPDLPAELTRAELFEAELWHITGLDPARVDAIIHAAEKVYAGAA